MNRIKHIGKYTAKISEGQREQMLLKQIATLKRQLAAERERSKHEIAVLKSKINKVERKVSGLQKHNAIRNKVEKIHLQALDARIKREAIAKNPDPQNGRKMTKPQRKAYHDARAHEMFAPQLYERLEAHYGSAFNQEQLAHIRAELMSYTGKELYDMATSLGLNKMTYDSDATYIDEPIDTEAANVYEAITKLEYIAPVK